MTLRDLMLEHRPAIRTRVLEKLRLDHPDVSDNQLLYDLDGFYQKALNTLTATMEDQHPAEPAKDGNAEAYGDHRFEQVMDPASIVHDYGIVCDAIYELAGRHGLQVHPLEAQVLNRAIDIACADAITAYWQRDLQSSRNHVARQIGQLAHELRNGLQTVKIALSMIESGVAPARGRTAEVARRALDRMEDLVGCTLEDTRAYATAARALKRERIGLARLIDEILEMARMPPHLRAEVDADRTLEIDGDRRLLTSAISNLVHNAVKFTPEGGTVRVRAREEGVEVVVEVEDECGGLPDGAAEDLFRPFVQKGRDRSGVGLGLAIVREAVQAHGGRVSVRNLPRRGCIFTIVLPSLSARPIPAFRGEGRVT